MGGRTLALISALPIFFLCWRTPIASGSPLILLPVHFEARLDAAQSSAPPQITPQSAESSSDRTDFLYQDE